MQFAPGQNSGSISWVLLDFVGTSFVGPIFDHIADQVRSEMFGPSFDHHADTPSAYTLGPVFDHDAQPLIITVHGPVFDHISVSLIPGFGPSFDHDATEVPPPYAFPITPVPPNTDRLRLQPETFGSPAIYPGGRGR
jgi:hypothetical protein